MQHRMMEEAQRAMAPWVGGQPVYGPMAQASSSQINPLLYAGTTRTAGKILLSLYSTNLGWCFFFFPHRIHVREEHAYEAHATAPTTVVGL